MRRSALTLASVANTVTGPQTSIFSPDDNTDRIVRQVYASPATAGVIYELRRAGFLVAAIDALRFAAGNEPVTVDERWPATIPFSIDVVNNSGGAYVGTVTIGYDPVPYPDYRAP